MTTTQRHRHVRAHYDRHLAASQQTLNALRRMLVAIDVVSAVAEHDGTGLAGCDTIANEIESLASRIREFERDLRETVEEAIADGHKYTRPGEGI